MHLFWVLLLHIVNLENMWLIWIYIELFVSEIASLYVFMSSFPWFPLITSTVSFASDFIATVTKD